MHRLDPVIPPAGLAEICRPEQMAIVIYDMQSGIVPQIGSGARIVEGCQALLARCREQGYRIFYTRHISLPNSRSGLGQLRRAMIWQGKADPSDTHPPFLPAAPQTQIVAELRPADEDVVIDKITMSAFEGTYLNIALRDLGISAFAIAGIALDVGIEPTVRHSLDLNYIPVVLTDLCGSRTEELHQRSIDTLRETGEVVFASNHELMRLLAARQ